MDFVLIRCSGGGRECLSHGYFFGLGHQVALVAVTTGLGFG